MKHFGYESYSRWFVRIFFCKFYSEFKCAVFKRCVMWTVIENNTNFNHSNTFNSKICRSSLEPLYSPVLVENVTVIVFVSSCEIWKEEWHPDLGLERWLRVSCDRKVRSNCFRVAQNDQSHMLSWLDLALPGTSIAVVTVEVILSHFRDKPLKYGLVTSLLQNLEVPAQISELSGHFNWWQGCWEKSMQKWNVGCIQISSQTVQSFVVYMKACFIGMKQHYG